MSNLTLNADTRSTVGRKVKKLRREGLLPANIYGKKFKSQAIQVNFSKYIKLSNEAGETTLIGLVLEGKKIPVTISIGVASFRQTPEDQVNRFIKDADEAMYFSKEHGRNRVTLHGQEKKIKKAA